MNGHHDKPDHKLDHKLVDNSKRTTAIFALKKIRQLVDHDEQRYHANNRLARILAVIFTAALIAAFLLFILTERQFAVIS